MPTFRRTWIKRGFLAYEAIKLSAISPAGSKAPYIQRMIRKRVSLNANRVRYKWSNREYLHRVMEDYARAGLYKGKRESYAKFFERTFREYFLWYKDTTPTDPTWQTPKPKRFIRRHKDERKSQYTKRQMLRKRIDTLNDQISKASLQGNQRLRRELEITRNSYQMDLDFLSAGE